MNTAEGFEPKVEADHISLLVVWGGGIGILVGMVVGCFVALALMNAWAKGEPLARRAPREQRDRHRRADARAQHPPGARRE